MKQCRMSVKLTAIPARQMPLCSRLMTDTGDLEDPHSLSSGSCPESQLARAEAGSGPRLPGKPGSTASLFCPRLSVMEAAGSRLNTAAPREVV